MPTTVAPAPFSRDPPSQAALAAARCCWRSAAPRLSSAPLPAAPRPHSRESRARQGPARWRPEPRTRRAPCRLDRAWESGGMSSRARRRDRVWPPPHRRDLKGCSLPRVDPATRCSPTWPLKRIWRATAVSYLQRDVFVERSALNRIPAMLARRPHYQFSSRCSTIAGLSGFFTLIQSRDGPDL